MWTRYRFGLGMALLLACLTIFNSAAKAAENPGFWDLCATTIGAAETRREVPHRLLQALALVEAGRWNKARRENIAWPWTVMAEGRGRYLPTKAAAIAEVRALRDRGIKNIDVGCMQVNLGYHPDAFNSLDEAFEPATNVAYAAKFLLSLRAESRSWTRAIGHYHSRKPIASNNYRRKVLQRWREEKRKANALARQERKRAQAAALTKAPEISPEKSPEKSPVPAPGAVTSVDSLPLLTPPKAFRALLPQG